MHFHSTASDGRNPQEAILERIGNQEGLFVLTDHDVIGKDFAQALRDAGKQTFEGVEISAKNYELDKSLHLTCYAHSFSAEAMDLVAGIRVGRQEKIQAQLLKLQEHGFEVSIEDFFRFFKEKWVDADNLNTYHVSVYIIKNPKNRALIQSIRASEKVPEGEPDSISPKESERISFLKDFLRDSWPLAHIGTQKVRSYEPSVQACAELTQKHQWILSIAHPIFTFARNGVEGFKKKFPNYYEQWVNAIEINVRSTQKWIDATLELQKQFGVLITFGSDCHDIDRADAKHGLLWEINPLLDADFVEREVSKIQKKLTS